MQDEQAEQDEAVEPTAEDTSADAEAGAEDTSADAEAGADDAVAASDDDSADEADSADDSEAAEGVDMSASPGGAGETVLQEPEVPDDANSTIAAAQEHINSLNMDEEREAAEQAAKDL